jgi:hypothetical protein
MILKFTACSATRCTLTRLGRTANRGTQNNPGMIALTLRVTSHMDGKAVTLGGTYAVQVPADPPDCTSNGNSLQDAYGGRD